MTPNSEREPIVIKFQRVRYVPRAVLFDANLDLHGIDELRRWAKRGIAFVVLDSETGEDVTRVLLA
jgi:polyhydroxyalkanoate synthesis regulator protein